MNNVWFRDPELGRVTIPPRLLGRSVYPSGRIRSVIGECGVFHVVQKRPVFDETGRLLRMDVVMTDFTHNERVDAGANLQAFQLFGGGSSPGTPSATIYPLAIAIANAALTKAKTDLSLGSASSAVTTNEFITNGLARVAAQAIVGGDYTAPSSLGGVFTQNLKKTFTASGAGGTAKGAGVFDRVAVASSVMYVEDNFTDAVLIAADTLTVTAGISN